MLNVNSKFHNLELGCARGLVDYILKHSSFHSISLEGCVTSYRRNGSE